jgi:hypothetical protein
MYALAVVLAALWLLFIALGMTFGGWVHALLILAIAVAIFRLIRGSAGDDSYNNSRYSGRTPRSF